MLDWVNFLSSHLSRIMGSLNLASGKQGWDLTVPASSYTELGIMGNCTVRREKSLLGIVESSEMPSQLKRGE